MISDNEGVHVREARSAPWMYAASSLIRRISPGGSPARVDTMMRLQGLALQAREHALRGEEIVMEAGRG